MFGATIDRSVIHLSVEARKASADNSDDAGAGTFEAVPWHVGGASQHGRKGAQWPDELCHHDRKVQ